MMRGMATFEPQVDDPLELTIESLAYGGAGVARLAGRVVFVRGSCPGERVTARVTRRHPRYIEAQLIAVEKAAAERIAPVCQVALPEGGSQPVPGCVYAHLAYPAEVAAKQRQLTDLLVRQARLTNVEDILAPPTPSPRDLGYRNKIVLHAGFRAGAFGLGYVGDDNRSVIDLPACPLAVPPINAVLAELRRDARFRRELRCGNDVTLRWTEADGVVAWRGDPPPAARWLRETTGIGTLEVPCAGFFQVNGGVASLLLEGVTDAIRTAAPQAVVDAYCGAGVFALAAAAAGVPRVLGCDTGREAIAAARCNARRLGLAAEFACLPASEGLGGALDDAGAEATCVVVDPPREGLDAEVRRTLIESRAPNVVYVSCAPDTLARDLAALRRGGYRLASCALYDMFPRTAHFETLAVLRRSGA